MYLLFSSANSLTISLSLFLSSTCIRYCKILDTLLRNCNIDKYSRKRFHKRDIHIISMKNDPNDSII